MPQSNQQKKKQKNVIARLSGEEPYVLLLSTNSEQTMRIDSTGELEETRAASDRNNYQVTATVRTVNRFLLD
jgi:GGDEF domain-containing protein